MKIEAISPEQTLTDERQASIKPVTIQLVTKDGCFPEGSYLTTNRVEFFFYHGKWQLPQNPRMDGVVRIKHQIDSTDPYELEVVEMNKLEVGDLVIKGETEDGSEGIYVTGLGEKEEQRDMFAFMGNTVSRERRTNYEEIARVLKNAKENNKQIVWVLGPAIVHAGGIEAMEWLIHNGYVSALFGGNAIAAHDIEHAIVGTSLGNNDRGHAVHNGHRNHLEAINRIRQLGSIEEAVKQEVITNGIIYACIKNNIPFILAGSIRDDGPLPDVITDNLQAQNAMRQYTAQADVVVTMATALHSIATGNMTPTYKIHGDEIHPVTFICVDNDEFLVNKLSDRGTSQAFPVITNARDALSLIVAELAQMESNN